MLSEKGMKIVKADMVAAGVQGDIIHIIGDFYCLANDGIPTHGFKLIVGNERNVFYEMMNVYGDYYVFGQYLWDITAKVCGIMSDLQRNIFEKSIIKKILPILIRYGVDIVEDVFLTANRVFLNYDTTDDSVYIWANVTNGYVFAHVYSDDKAGDVFEVFIDKQDKNAEYYNKFAKFNIIGTPRIFGCCKFMKRLLKTKNITFPFAHDNWWKIELIDSTYHISYDYKDYKNRKTYMLQIVGDALVPIEDMKLPTSAELKFRHINQLRKYVLERKNNSVITVPEQFYTPTGFSWIYRLCKSRGYSFIKGEKNDTCYIITIGGESDNDNSTEFSDFPRGEEASAKYIADAEQIIRDHTKIENCKNTITINNWGMTQSYTCLKWLKNLDHPYSINYSTSEITITLF
jgi:hypothetical protein